jgi:hypothetical protein
MNACERLNFTGASTSAKAKREEFYARVTKPRTGGSDAHYSVAVGDCYTLVQSAPNAEAIRAAILAGHTTPCALQSEVEMGHMARHNLAGSFNLLYTRASTALLSADSFLAHLTNMDYASISPSLQPGFTLTKQW